MTINNNYRLNQLSPTSFVLESSSEGKLIILNNTAAFIWKCMASGDTCLEELNAKLVGKYKVEPSKALEDLKNTISLWKSLAIINV